MTQRCGLWVRVSKDEQDTGNQLDQLRQRASRRQVTRPQPAPAPVAAVIAQPGADARPGYATVTGVRRRMTTEEQA
jgi:DNA invertase Pin-like site-specific DNA recombinase